CTREDRPRLRNRIDLAFVLLGRAQRRAVVVVSPAVPFAIPCELELCRQPSRLVRIARRASAVLPRVAQAGEGTEHAVQEEAQPGALAVPPAPDAVHPIVPVAR